MGELLPTAEEFYSFVLDTLRHSFRMEILRRELGIMNYDPDTPHDLAGPYNKYEWNVMKGLALRYRDNVDFVRYIVPARDLHRRQRHHQMWNFPNPSNPQLPRSEATEEDLKFGASDAICALWENRPYNPQITSLDDIPNIATGAPYQVDWIRRLVPRVREIGMPGIEVVVNIFDFPNPGVSNKLYIGAKERIRETIVMLKGYNINLESAASSVGG